MLQPKVTVLIPTYNEPDELARCVDSILGQHQPLTVIVINAGLPLAQELAAKVTEIAVPDDWFWTACMQRGLEVAREERPDFLLLSNADNRFLDGCVPALLRGSVARPRAILASPAYHEGDGDLELQYSHQDDWGILLYGKIRRAWKHRSEAPSEGFRIDLTGGQGVLIPMEAMEGIRFAVEDLPHYASDHDLWLQLRARGWPLWLQPDAGITNQRQFSRKSRGSLVRTLWWRLTSDRTPESAVIMWRLRRRHLPWLVAIVSFAASLLLRWTLGLPGILRRS